MASVLVVAVQAHVIAVPAAVPVMVKVLVSIVPVLIVLSAIFKTMVTEVPAVPSIIKPVGSSSVGMVAPEANPSDVQKSAGAVALVDLPVEPAEKVPFS